MAEPVDFTADLARITTMTPTELRDLQTRLAAAFDAADTDDDLTLMGSIADQLDQVRVAITAVKPETPKAETAKPAVPAPATPPAEPPAEPVETPAEPAPVETPAADAPAEPTVVDAPSEVVAETITEPVAQAPETPVATVTEMTQPPAQAATSNTTTTPVQEGTPVAASASTVAVPEGSEPIVASSGSRVYAGADIPGTTAGYEFQSVDEFGNALAKRLNTLTSLRGGDGEQVVIASIVADSVAPERTLSFNDPTANMEKIQAITDPDSFVQGNELTGITAAGGCCAPLVTRYNLWDNGGVTDRPVRDALASFRAERGGIRYFAGPALADLQGALGFWTCADDAAADPADTGTWKVCARINCPPEQTAELQAITMCLTFGVLQTRIFPELAVANNKLALIAQARLADAALLAQIKAGSTAVTDGGTTWGAVRDLMNAIGRATMYYRDRYRLRSAPLRAIMPAWVLECLRTDLLDGPDWGRDWGKHYGVSEDEIRSFFSARNINVTFALDSSDPSVRGGGFFPAITGAALPTFPTTVQWALYPEGAWLFLDGGQLDLGIIRDSTLVRTNDYMQFSETFEAAALIGGESLWVTSTIDVSGKYPAAV